MLVQELREAGLLSEGRAQGRMPTVHDLANLRFLNAVFHEGVRTQTKV
jgi:hypothetical protein